MGVGNPYPPSDPAMVTGIQVNTVVMNILIGLATALSKSSFGITLMRITRGRTKEAIVTLTILLNFFVFLNIIFSFLKCSPKSLSWIKGDGCWSNEIYVSISIFVGGKSIDIRSSMLLIGTLAFSAFVDFIFAIIPWFLLMNLQMIWKEKVGVAIAMSFGAVCDHPCRYSTLDPAC